MPCLHPPTFTVLCPGPRGWGGTTNTLVADPIWAHIRSAICEGGEVSSVDGSIESSLLPGGSPCPFCMAVISNIWCARSYYNSQHALTNVRKSVSGIHIYSSGCRVRICSHVADVFVKISAFVVETIPF